jgi:Tol biopolymer transport system component
VNLGTTINTAANEQGPTLSKDGLTLYFGSDRTGGSGSFDLYIARRACADCAWEAPVNLGPIVNTASSETGPSLSIDGHLLFFTGNRPGGQGLQDIYLSRRADPQDDLGWGPPVGLGPGVNTAGSDAGAEYLQAAEEGTANFYFNRAPPSGVGTPSDLYYASLTRDGETLGPAVLIAELSDPVGTDQGPSLRTDAKEIYFFSTRAGGLGGNDLYVSSRQNANEAWSTPVNLGAPMNSTAADQQPGLSTDGRTLVFASSRTGGFGGTDIWISTRTPSGK